jgi:predicted Zn-dependent protease
MKARFLLIISLCWALLCPALAYPVVTEFDLKEITNELKIILQQSPFVLRDPVVTEYVDSVAKRLTQANDLADDTIETFVINDSMVNAFAGPGGYLGVFTGLILATNNESELAAVMAHELAHVKQKHILRTLQRQKKQTAPMIASALASIALGLLNPALAAGALAATTSGFAQDAITYTRNHEHEADRIGIQMLYNADFNVDSMAGFFANIQQRDRLYYTDHIPPILRTHPLDYERIAEAKQRAGKLPDRKVVESDLYPLIKEYVRTLTEEDHQKLTRYYADKRQKHPDNNAYRFGAALTALQSRQWDDAERELQTLIQKDPAQLLYHMTLAQLFIEKDNPARAVAILQPLFAEHPAHYPLLLHYSQALMRNQQAELARQLLQKESYQRRDDIQLWQLLARAQAQAGRTADAYASRAEAMIILGYYRDAQRQLEHALTLTDGQRLASARISARIEYVKQFVEK